jgi:hypothetical protein
MNVNELKPNDLVEVAAGICRVVRAPVKKGRILGADLIRLRSGNYALDGDGKPYETPSVYTEHFPDYLIYRKVDPGTLRPDQVPSARSLQARH